MNSYFSKIFQSSEPQMESIDHILETIPTSISDEQNDVLVQKFSKEEIWGVLKSMHPIKAPGPDGLQAIFYQKFWDIVGEDTCKICLQYLNGELSLKEINKTLIALIPKVKDPKMMKDYRPISLCNVIYKIIAKVIANRLKRVLDMVISPTQSTFVPGRLITDNAIIGFECIHAVKKRRSGKDGVVALKLDMSKAYDRVEWIYIRSILGKMGFNSRWVDLVMRCVESVAFQVLLSGTPRKEFVPKRGLRQDDLSPRIFSLSALRGYRGF